MNPTLSIVVAIAAVVVVGLLVGVELCVAVFVNPIFDRLPGDGGLAARSDGARVLGRVMPFWYVASVVLAIATALVVDDGWGRGAAASAAGLLVVSVLVSVTLLVPINDRVKTWSTGGAPADWREQVSRWDRLHHLRVAVIVLAFVLLAVALHLV